MSERSAVKLTYRPLAVAPAPKNVGTAAPKSIDDVGEALKRKLGDGAVKSVEKAHKGDPFVIVSGDKLFEALQFLRDDERFLCTNLNVVSAIDYPPAAPAAEGEVAAPKSAQNCVEVVYVVSSYAHRHQIMVKVQLPRDNPKVASVSDLFRAANWYERECFDMIGVRFEGHPNHARILLPPDWVGHPLRRDYVFPEEYNGMKVPL